MKKLKPLVTQIICTFEKGCQFKRNALSIQDSSASVQVDQKEISVVGMQNGGNPQAEAIFYHSQRLQDDLQTLGLKIKLHEDHIKLLKSQSNKLDDSILESQGTFILLTQYINQCISTPS
ncbi:hypothetical protein Pint_22664 [Pistacia integerrima]|uniref:Uncharacterized protein n=1 Tax=Pistacia integerrima TaxID=434235 RepID=A0ACC0YLD6_9ROSI|nr:hypothetical protein Pint_22664 [Pistacia integerrima]